MISNIKIENKNVLFIHIPKNAGTTVGKILGIENPSHIKAKEIIFNKGIKFFNSFFSVAVIRNPIERFISLYNYARLEVSYYHNNINPNLSRFGKHLDYELLKNATINECVNYLIEGKLIHDLTWNQWEPQYTWVCDTKNNIIVNKLYSIDDLNEFIIDIGRENLYKKNIPFLNSSKENSLEENLNRKSMGILIEFYKKDFELLNK
jgi:chondroitin 4-sulfotransferase 11